MASRKAAHTHADRTVIRPSHVTSESETDANAGATAATGVGTPASCLVGKILQTP